jgi:hypothetical protein
MSFILRHDINGNSLPFNMNDDTPAIDPVSDVQKQIRIECAKLADLAKNWAGNRYSKIFNSDPWFFASPEMVIRVDLNTEIDRAETNETSISILLILLRASRAPKTRDINTSIEMVCGDIAAMLIEKNRAYGNSALAPIRKFSKASSIEQILVRLDDKLSRLARGQAAGEDVEKDLIGYLVLLRIARYGV